MKIVFLCGSLEPGCDGVGDYTRRLAGELTREGHTVSLLALYDNRISADFGEIQENEGTGIHILRIPVKISDLQRFSIAKSFIGSENPEWISLQFVLFAYHNKGLPFGLPRRLQDLGKGRKWHIMFHELWVGMHKGASLSLKIWGAMQQLLILGMIKKLAPKVIHTQTEVYCKLLNSFKVEASILSLFGNIPVKECSKEVRDPKKLTFVIFGSIHPNAPVEEFTSELAGFSEKNSLKVKLVLVGRNGHEKLRWKNAWKAKGFDVESYDPASVDLISRILQNADFGITTTSLALTAKSGSVAAMLEHKTPVICVSKEWKLRKKIEIVSLPSVLEYKETQLEKIINASATVLWNVSVESTASIFINSLKEQSLCSS
jgi:hypothetical protein